MNAHQMWITFRNIIDNFQNECVPLKKMRNAQMKKPLWCHGGKLASTKH